MDFNQSAHNNMSRFIGHIVMNAIKNRVAIQPNSALLAFSPTIVALPGQVVYLCTSVIYLVAAYGAYASFARCGTDADNFSVGRLDFAVLEFDVAER
jgi:hypothetical protein